MVQSDSQAKGGLDDPLKPPGSRHWQLWWERSEQHYRQFLIAEVKYSSGRLKFIGDFFFDRADYAPSINTCQVQDAITFTHVSVFILLSPFS